MSSRLIILPKKTWNVYNREAIARVRNDERQNAEAEAVKRERQRSLDSEARLELLRQRAHGEGTMQDTVHVDKEDNGDTDECKHMNFFPVSASGRTNQEAENAKRINERLQLRRLGIAPLPLGGTAEERMLPWWTQRDVEPRNSKRRIDHSEGTKKISMSSNKCVGGGQEKQRARKRDKKDKKRERGKKEKEKKSPEKEGFGLKQRDIDHLRGKRLRREEAERSRASALTQESPIKSQEESGPHSGQFYPEWDTLCGAQKKRGVHLRNNLISK